VEYLRNTGDIALVSDAGTPGVADPAFNLVRECVREKIPVLAIPGPSAMITALVSSGLPTDRFRFENFSPKKSAQRLHMLEHLRESADSTMNFFASPHNWSNSRKIKTVFGAITVARMRELTKNLKNIWWDTLRTAAHLKNACPKGSCSVVSSTGKRRIMIPFIFLQCIAGIILFALKPDSAGLYTFLPHGIPLLITIPFLFYSDFRKHFNKYLYFFAGIHFVFLTLDYTLNGHASVVSLGIIFIPVFFLVYFILCWNIHSGHEKSPDKPHSLHLAWGFFACPFLHFTWVSERSLFGSMVYCTLSFLSSRVIRFIWSGMLYNAIIYY
jgi:hypothetical protein